MNKRMQLAAVLVVLLVGLAFLAPANAAIVTTLGDWENDGPIQDQDKIYTYISDIGLDDDVPVTFQLLVLAGIDSHRVTLFDSVTFYVLATPGTYQLVYSVEVDPLDTLRFIDYVSLAVDGANLGDVTVTKRVYDVDNNLLATLVNTGGVFQETSIPLRKYLRIEEDFVLTGGGAITATTNVYEQTVVPEPASLLIWSLLGVVGVSVWARRRGTTARWSPKSRDAICSLIERGRNG